MAVQSRLSKNCVESIIEYINATAQSEVEFHLCEIHGDKSSCDFIEKARVHEEQLREKVWKYCFKW